MKRPTSEWLVDADVGHNNILQHNKHIKTQHPSRRSRGDMIETYKLLTGKYDQQVALTLPKNVTGEYFTRGNCNKLLVKRCTYEPRKNFLSNRIVNMWNSLLTMSLCMILLIISKTDMGNIGNTEIFYSKIIGQDRRSTAKKQNITNARSAILH